MFVVTALVVGAVWSIVWTDAGTRFALERGLSTYDDMIPGHATVESIEGSLADGVVLEGVRIEDRHGRPILEAASLSLRVDPWRAMASSIETGTIRIEGLRVWALDHPDGGFGDLGPEGPPEPEEEPPTPGYGPDLPIDLVGTIELVDAVVFAGPVEGPSPSVVVPELALDLRAGGTTANASVVGRLCLPAADLDVYYLALDVAWADPAAEIGSLLVQSNAGDVEIEAVRIDLAKESFGVDRLDARPSAQWLRLPIGDTRVEVRGAGAIDEFSLDVEATLVDGGEVGLSIAGALAPEPVLHVWIDAALDEARAVGVPALPPLLVTAQLDASGDPAIGSAAALELTCHGCAEDLGALTLQADAFAGENGRWGALTADLRASDVTLDVDAAVDPNGVGGATIEARVPSLAALSPIVQRFAPELDLAGALAIDIACAGIVDPRAGTCRAVVDLEHGRPVRRLALDLSAALGEAGSILVELRELLVEAEGARIELDRPLARLEVAPDRAVVEDLGLRVASRTGEGRVDVDGSLALAQPRHATARVRIRGLAASAANAFVPDLGARGRIDASVDLAGPLASPEIVVSVRGRGVGAKGHTFGDLGVSASYRGGRARADLELDDGDFGRADVHADLPVALDLDAGSFSLDGSATARAHVEVDDFPLEVLRRFVDGVETLSGRVDVDVDLKRSLRRPTIDAKVELADARYDGKALPHVDLDAHYEKSTLTATLDATHATAFERLHLEASVPLDLDLARGRARWRSEREHSIDLAIDGARVEEAYAWEPSIVAKGRVDLDLGVVGSMHAPRIDAEVHGRGLHWDHRAVGDVSVALHYADESATAQVHASGPAFAGLGVDAEVPVTVVPATGTFAWHPEREHRLHVSLEDLLVEQALAWVPTKDPADTIVASGRLDADVVLTGPATAPVIAVDTSVADATYGHREVGTLGLQADYDVGRVVAVGDWEQSPGHTARVRVDVPLALDLPHGGATWDRLAEHHLRVDVPRIDRELLAPFVDTGDFDATLALTATADGNAEAFDLDATLRGTVAGGRVRHPLHARLSASERAQTLNLRLGPASRRFGVIDATTQVPVLAVIEGADWKTAPLQVRVDLSQVDLSTFDGLTPIEIQQLEGKLTVDATVAGTLGAPKLDGRVHVRGGAATIVPARQRIEQLEVVAALTNESVDLTKLRFEAGGGSVNGRGNLRLREGAGLVATVDLTLDDVPIRSPGLPRMEVTSKVATKVAMDLDDTSIEVGLRETKVDVYTSSIAAGDPIPTNENVTFVDFDAPPTRTTESATTEPAPGRRTRFTLVLADPLRIVGPSVDMAWKGKIEADGADARGALTADKGYFDLLGNDFDIEQGTVTLPDDGSNTPFVDLIARTSVDDIQITATVRGKLPKPELILSSSPSMTQSEIFTVLVTGSADTETADPDEVEAKAATMLAAVSNPVLQRHINEKLHVDRVGVSFGETTEQPILSAGKNVTKKVYVETQYHHNAPRQQNRAELRVEYRFAKRWSVETFFGDAAAGGVDLFWGRAFDSKPRPTGSGSSP